MIPCSIGSSHENKSLCDLGSSINLMPLHIYNKLGLKEMQPTGMSLQLADRTCKSPLGVVQDVKIKVGKFTFPVDFVIMKIKDQETPIILGRAFLATGNTLIDVQEGKISLKVRKEKISFDMKTMMKIPKDRYKMSDFEEDWELQKDYDRKSIIRIDAED